MTSPFIFRCILLWNVHKIYFTVKAEKKIRKRGKVLIPDDEPRWWVHRNSHTVFIAPVRLKWCQNNKQRKLFTEKKPLQSKCYFFQVGWGWMWSERVIAMKYHSNVTWELLFNLCHLCTMFLCTESKLRGRWNNRQRHSNEKWIFSNSFHYEKFNL